jgi:hypothetical protein
MSTDRTAFDCKESLTAGHCFVVCAILAILSDRDAHKTYTNMLVLDMYSRVRVGKNLTGFQLGMV